MERATSAEGWSDSNWTGNLETGKSTNGGLFKFGTHVLKTWSTTQELEPARMQKDQKQIESRAREEARDKAAYHQGRSPWNMYKANFTSTRATVPMEMSTEDEYGGS